MPSRPDHFALVILRLLLIGALVTPVTPAGALETPAPLPSGAIPASDAGRLDGPGAPAASPAGAAAVARFLTLPLDRLTPMQREIRQCIAQEQLELARLSAAYAGATSDDEALALQRQIHAVKTAAERSVLQIQLAWARAEARQDAILQLEEALAVLDRGSAERQRADRNAPGGSPR